MKTEEVFDIDFPARYTHAPDGARIRYFDSEEDLPALVFANGLGGPVSAWDPYFRRWRGHYRLLTWDYRGLYGSTLPHRQASLKVNAHAEDLRAVLDAAGVERAALLGWSMGVQVGLEFYSQSPTRLSHLALINGTYGRPLDGVPIPFASLALPPLVRGVRRLHWLGERLLYRLAATRTSFRTVRRLKLVAPGLDEERFLTMVGDFRTVDLDLYFDLLSHLHAHDAEPYLRNVGIPTLVIAGSRDVITPVAAARKIAKIIPGAELFVIPDGTHYSAAEYPDLVASRIELFYRGAVSLAAQ